MNTTPTDMAQPLGNRPACAPAAARTISRWAVARLAVMALGGLAVYYVVLVAPIVLLMRLNPWYGHYGIWPVLAVLAFLCWTLQPFAETVGTLVSREQAPALFNELERLAEGIGAPRIDEIRLVDDFNAAAMEASMAWRFWRKRRVLVLGVPLLALTDVDDARGVIAHELGHFSHRHGRLGQWIYRARVAWSSYAHEPLASVSLFERGAAFFAHWFAPYFSKQAFTYSRLCEYEADAYAASVVGPVPMAAGLLTIATLGRRWADMSDKQLPRLIAEQDAPPPAWIAHVQQHVLTQPAQAGEFELLKDAASTADDTHPSTAERIQALAVTGEEALQACRLPAPVAGAAWFVDWSAIVERHNAEWREQNASVWRQEHIRQRHQRERLGALRAAGDASIERAQLELEYGEPATVIELVQPWLDDAAAGSHARFLLGAAQLRAGDRLGVASLEACVKADPLWAFAARELIAQHPPMLADDWQRERNAILVERARNKRSAALGLLLDRLQQGDVAPTTLAHDAQAILREVFSGSPAVAAAWCAEVSELVHDKRRYRAVVLVLRLRTQRLRELDLTEDDLRDEARALLGKLLPGSVLRLVWTVYTTEPLSPELDARLSEWSVPGHPACLVLPEPGESVGAGARAAALR